MRGTRLEARPASWSPTDYARQQVVPFGVSGGGGHSRVVVEPIAARRPLTARITRSAYAALIAASAAIVVFRELTGRSGATDAAGPIPHVADLVWALPAIATGAAVWAVLVVASASRTGIATLERFGVPGLGPNARARANGMSWSALGVLAVHFTGEAFDVVPGGHQSVAIVLGILLGLGTSRLHRHAIEHEAYRTFNLLAMLLAAGCLASMSLTPTGAWWTHNFSTLGTSDDIAAACFNIAILVAGAGIAAMSPALTRAVAEPRFGVRRGGLTAMRVLIAIIGMSLMGVGLVPIDGATDLHNLAASGAALAFAVLCLGVQLWARRMPRALVAASYTAIVMEVAAAIAYDGIGLFNLTVFEVIAFTLVFAWLIALVAVTHAHHTVPDAAAGRHAAPPVAERARRAARVGPRRIPSRSPRRSRRLATFHEVRRPVPGGGADEPPEALAAV